MLVDAHTHIDRYDLVGGGALATALAEITEHEILTISNSMDPASYRRTLEISRACDWVLPTLGVHPWHAPEYAGCLEDLVESARRTPMIGEIGLDHYFVQDASAYPAQRQVFEFFLAAAEDQGKIVNLHTKGAEEEVLAILDQYALPRVIVHWDSGPLDIFQDLVARGVYFTVGIEVLHSEHLQAIAREIPSDRLLTETDNPGGPKGFLGKPGMPALLKDVIQGIATARETGAGAIVETVEANLLALAGNDPWLAKAQAGISAGAG